MESLYDLLALKHGKAICENDNELAFMYLLNSNSFRDFKEIQ